MTGSGKETELRNLGFDLLWAIMYNVRQIVAICSTGNTRIFKRRDNMKKTVAWILTLMLCLTGTVCVFAAESGQPVTTSSYSVTVYFNDGYSSLALKTAPDKNASNYMNIPFGTSLHIDQVSGGWGQVTYNGMNGWVPLHDTKVVGNYPTPQPSGGQTGTIYYTVYNTEGEGLEQRTGPTTDASTFGPLYDGTVFKTEARVSSTPSGDWVYGEHDGHYGWCNTHYLRNSSQDEINRYEAEAAARKAQQETTPPQPETTPAPPQQSEETSPTDSGFVQAYIDILNTERDAIDLYQPETDVSGSVVLSNIYGDDTPELIYMKAVLLDSDGAYQPELHIVTFENGAARTLFVSNLGKSNVTGGYFNYYMFRMSGKPSLYLYQDIGDDGGQETYSRLDNVGDGTMTMTELFRHKYSGPEGSSDEYFRKGESITAEEYDAGIAKAHTDTSELLMATSGCGSFVDNYVAQYGCSAMTAEEALTYISSLTGSAGAVPAEQPSDQSSGAVISF